MSVFDLVNNPLNDMTIAIGFLLVLAIAGWARRPKPIPNATRKFYRTKIPSEMIIEEESSA